MKELEELTREIRENLPRLKGPKTFKKLGGIYIETFNSIMLNDVLEWINEMTDDMTNINSEGVIYFTNFWNNPSDKVSNWDLSKPYLKDQSPELITFLHGFIKK
ncbi:hypothetical protein [Chryseobacterium arthrosphaerae]|uniref:hypothetical protein n=1 Tax=Chryseobacterium arthrosphaerae TaxID=651561 RepID=UPI0031DD7B85